MIKLIKASCDNEYPLCVHYGFLVGDVVVHNTPDKTNPYGGNIVAQSFENFKKKEPSMQSKIWIFRLRKFGLTMKSTEPKNSIPLLLIVNNSQTMLFQV
jgi:hypothetical protein